MASFDRPERPRTPFSQQTPYIKVHQQHGSFSSSSPPTAYRPMFRVSSPTMTAISYSTLGTAPSAPRESGDEERKSRDFSQESEVNYAEITDPQPQFLYKSPSRDDEKQAYRNTIISNRSGDSDGLQVYKVPRKRPTRRCGCRMPIFWTAIFIILFTLAVALGLGLGLGLGLHKSHSSDSSSAELEASQTLIGGAINPQYFSKQGAFNGTGIAVASTNQGTLADLFVFYQRYTGEIQQLYFDAGGRYQFVTTVASNAKNATPLSTVAYVYNSVAITHLFYIDRSNYIRERITSNSSQTQTNIWYDGPLNALNLKSYDHELVGMQACYWGNYYGSSSNFNYTGYPSKTEPTTGINLMFASDNSTFQQYDWTNGNNAWNYSNSFTSMNTRAGIGCQSWLTNTTQYLAMVDSTNTMRVLWRDTDANKTSTTSHPIGVWTKTNISFPNVHPSTSIGYTDFLVYQDSKSMIQGVAINWAAENTTIQTISPRSPTFDTWAIDSSSRGIPGTHHAITALDTASGGRQLALFYQSISNGDNGSGVTIGWRDSSYQGSWSYASVPVNQTV